MKGKHSVPYIPMKLQARDKTGDWIDIWPNQFHQMLKQGLEIRVIESTPLKSKREWALERAALDFIHKVDRGEAKSTKSYAAFKAALAVMEDTNGNQ